jgi:hypothetical protein
VARPTAPRVDAAERDAAALDLRAAGLSIRQVARELGCSSTTAHRRVVRGLDRTLREPADRVRALELHRLDQLQARATTVLGARHVVMQGGRVVVDQQGQPYPDHGPALAAIAALLRIAERRAKLLGLDAPTSAKVDVSGEVYSLSAIDTELARLHRELYALDSPQPPAADQHPPDQAPPASALAPVDVGGLVAAAVDAALDAAAVPAGIRREAAYTAAERQLREVDQ